LSPVSIDNGEQTNMLCYVIGVISGCRWSRSKSDILVSAVTEKWSNS